MAIPIYQVDAFTDEAFKGNPAGVCLLTKPADPDWMQHVARDMNNSETAFALPRKKDGFDLRWFTPTTEVKLCGHATLATAHILWEQKVLKADEEAHFHTLSGLLTAKRAGAWIEMNFPARHLHPEAPDWGHQVQEIIGISPTFVGLSMEDVLAEVEDEAAVRGLRPNLHLLRDLPVRGLIVTAPASTEGYDFVSRFFVPAVGIDEDPVTGSSHCVLAPYWAGRLGKTSFTAYQASTRGGVVKTRLEDDRVILGGKAVTIFRGDLMV